ncbi:protein ripply2 [Desmodus rotundus]|uniref:protein ripply2 n=1 Tax=Desmodus rotundus TaxID=9430 RepID=UPI0039E3A23C
METAECSEYGARECAHGRQLQGAPRCQTRLAGADSGSSGFWRPWVDAPGEQEEAPHQAEKGVSEPRVAGRASEGRRWFTRTGNTRPDGDTRPACPLLKSTPASRPAGGLMPNGPGMTEASGKLSRYRHPVRLFWPKSKCYDYLYQEAEALLKNFPIQATISFYEDSDSEDEIEELIGEN